jgi:hypothetical protein
VAASPCQAPASTISLNLSRSRVTRRFIQYAAVATTRRQVGIESRLVDARRPQLCRQLELLVVFRVSTHPITCVESGYPGYVLLGQPE